MKKRLIQLLLVLSLAQIASAQGIISGLLSKTKEAISSDNKEQIWEENTPFLDPYRYTVPVTKRKFINIIPDEQLLSMSASQYRSYVKKSTLSSNKAKVAQLKRVSTKLSNATKRFLQKHNMSNEVKNYKWEFNLVKDKTLNAFCMPGGKIVVYEGITQVAKTDELLAMVLGHEIAHALAKHSAEQMTKSIISSVGLMTIISILKGRGSSGLSQIIASAGVTLLNLKFSRNNETEADRIGLIIAAMAGYNPEKAIELWEKMEEHEGGTSAHDWYSTHPSHANRIKNIRSFLPEAKKYYKPRK